jgi:hypothetical protein
MSIGTKFANYSTYKSIEKMDPMLRAQQYSFNGRIFLPPNPEPFANGNNNSDMTYLQNSGNSGQFSYQQGKEYNVMSNIMSDNTNTGYSLYNGNGLIEMTQGEATKPYDLYKNSNKAQETNVKIISNIVVPNGLSRTFFSNDNAERIQLQIINEVAKQFQKQIGKQSYQELQIIMKSMYLQYGRNLPDDIEGQVVILNKYVVDECVRIIGPNVLQYNKYIEDITSPIPIMPRSQNVSNKGYKFGDFSSLIPSQTIYNNINDK